MSELEELLDEDIRLLVKQLANPDDIDRAALRVSASTIARRWIADGQLAKLGHELGKVPTLPALDTKVHVAQIEKDGGFQFYTSGGAGLNGLPLNTFYAHGADREKSDEHRLQIPKEKNFALSKFKSRKCTFLGGHFLKTEDVIRFVANKTGGAHFDTTRDKFAEKLAEKARRFFLLGSDPHDQPVDHNGPYVYVPGMPPGLWDFTHIETLSIAQSLCNVKFDAEYFVKYRNLDEPADSPHQGILLGIRHAKFYSTDKVPQSGWITPPNDRNRE